MARYPLVDEQSGRVVNVIEFDPETAGAWAPPQGTSLGDPSDTVNPGDVWDGKAYVAPAPPTRNGFLAREFISLLTPEDFGKIKFAADGNAQFGLWYAALLSRGDAPIEFRSDTFKAAWGAVVAVLGQDRADELMARLV